LCSRRILVTRWFGSILVLKSGETKLLRGESGTGWSAAPPGRPGRDVGRPPSPEPSANPEGRPGERRKEKKGGCFSLARNRRRGVVPPARPLRLTATLRSQTLVAASGARAIVAAPGRRRGRPAEGARSGTRLSYLQVKCTDATTVAAGSTRGMARGAQVGFRRKSRATHKQRPLVSDLAKRRRSVCVSPLGSLFAKRRGIRTLQAHLSNDPTPPSSTSGLPGTRFPHREAGRCASKVVEGRRDCGPGRARPRPKKNSWWIRGVPRPPGPLAPRQSDRYRRGRRVRRGARAAGISKQGRTEANCFRGARGGSERGRASWAGMPIRLNRKSL